MAPSIRTLGEYADHGFYFVDFFGEVVLVTVTDSTSVIRRWIRDIRFRHRYHLHRLIVGVGVQWNPNDSSIDSPADTLQLCVGGRCLIIQLNYCSYLPQILRRFLLETDTTFVGVWNGQDARKLMNSNHELEIGDLLDIRMYVSDSDGWSLRSASFERIVEECLGHEGVGLHPAISMSDWDRYNLSHGQILQATVDAFVCFKLGVEGRLWNVPKG